MSTTEPTVLNVYHFGGIDKLPKNCVYVGRGPNSKYGNRYSSKDDILTKEECVALHRVDLYRILIDSPDRLLHLRQDLANKDLACWCKQPKRVVGCHGDNYLYILSDRLKTRLYDKTIIHYLMEDLRFVLKEFDDRLRLLIDKDHYLKLYIHFNDLRVDIRYVLLLCQEKYVEKEDLHFFVASVLVDLELAIKDPDLDVVEYRFDHVLWLINRFMMNRKDRDHEPISPHIPLKRFVKKGKTHV